MDYSSIFVLMVSYTLVFAVNDYFETKHGNEYQVLKENIVAKHNTDITTCGSHSTNEYDQCITEAEITRNASTVELYAKYNECSISKGTCPKIVETSLWL